MENEIQELKTRVDNIQHGLREIFNVIVSTAVLSLIGSVLIGYGLVSRDSMAIQLGSLLIGVSTLFSLSSIVYLWKSSEGVSKDVLKGDKFGAILKRVKFSGK